MRTAFLTICITFSGFIILSKSSSYDDHAFDHAPLPHAMIVCARAEASQVGIDILKKGGNAVDAAIAVQFALAVVYPDAGNLGGGGFMTIRLHDGTVNTLDFREKAPDKSSQTMFVNEKGTVDHDKALNSHLSSGVPGSVDGMWSAYQKYGSLPWDSLIQPAINIALNGFEVTARQANELNDNAAIFKKLNPTNTYLQKESPWKAGDTLIQPELAQTLLRIQETGRDGFYDGATAFQIEYEMKKNNGLITREDLKNYHSIWRQPLTAHYKNYTIITVPPPSGGGIALIQLLKIIENYPIAEWGKNDVRTIQTMVEAEKRVFADRSKWLGDPDFSRIPLAELMDSTYLKKRMVNFTPNQSTPSSMISGGSIAGYESEETTHFSIVDGQGNAVAVTTTLNDSYGSKIFVTGAGFLLNNEMDDFSAKPGTPNMYGLIGGEANAIEPGKRMLSSMTPTIILKNNELWMVIGTPGGSTIANTVFQNVLNMTDFNYTMQESVSTPRFHHQWRPDTIYYEHNAFNSDIIQKLKAMNYAVIERGPMGRVDAILVNTNGSLEAGTDPRGDDASRGY